MTVGASYSRKGRKAKPGEPRPELNFRGLPIRPHCIFGHRLTWDELTQQWRCFTCPRLNKEAAKTKRKATRAKPKNPVIVTWIEPNSPFNGQPNYLRSHLDRRELEIKYTGTKY